MNKTINVAITGMNALPHNPGPGLAVAKCLKESNIDCHIIGLSYDALDPGLYLNDLCSSSYLLPYPSTGDDAFMQRIKQIQEEENIDFLLPCLDAELPSMVRLAPQLKDLGIDCFLPLQDQLNMRNKDRLPELAAMAGIKCPKIHKVTSPQFFYDHQESDKDFPLVVKGVFYDARIVYSVDQAIQAFKSIASEWGYPVLVQEFIEGEEYNLSAVGDGQGNLLAPVMMKKLALTEKGKAWAGVSINDQALLTASTNLARQLRWRGPLEVEVMRDKQGEYNLIEINPRFPAWIYLSVGTGNNLPEVLLKTYLQHDNLKTQVGETGILYIRYAQDMTCPISRFEQFIVMGGEHHEQGTG